MGLLSLLNKDDQLKHYKRLRNAGRYLNNALVEQVPKAAITKYGKKLGLLKGNTLVLGSQDELSVLFDYCIYNHRQKRKTVYEYYIQDSQPDPESDEMIILKAMCKSYYSIFMVEDILRTKGVTVFDTLRQNTLFLMDMGIAKSSRKGLMFAGRILPLEDFHMTSGAFIPISQKLAEKKLVHIIDKLLKNKNYEDDPFFSPEQEAEFSAQVIKAALKAGALNHVVYEEK